MSASKQSIPFLLNLIAAVFGAAGQYLYKIGSLRIGAVPWVRNWPLFAGFLVYCVVMVIFIAGFRMGGRLSVTYPAYASTFVWATVLAVFFGKEPWTYIQILGVGTIITGLVLVAYGKPV